MSSPKKVATKRKAAKGYQRPKPIPAGVILTDVLKKSWRLGPSIGFGGFGDIYSAAEVTDSQKKTTALPYVVKIEPHENGPLFVEMHFYMRVCRPEDISAWQTAHKLTLLGVPRMLGSGSHLLDGIKHRFLVMDRFGRDVWALFTENGRCMPEVTALRIADQVLNALEYIHSKGYVHADIKGANLLLSATDPSAVFLVDFGMSTHASAKSDPRRAHNGTPEYAPRDAHVGAMTMRGDIETLCFNLLQWLAGSLPWETRLTDLPRLHAEKQTHMANIDGLLKACFKAAPVPSWLRDWLRLATAPAADAAPDYAALRAVLRTQLSRHGTKARGPLVFAVAAEPAKRPRGKAAALDKDDTDSPSPFKKAKPSRKNNAAAKNGKAAKARKDSESDEEMETDSKPVKKNGRTVKASKKQESNSDEEMETDSKPAKKNSRPLKARKKIESDSDDTDATSSQKNGGVVKRVGRNNGALARGKKQNNLIASGSSEDSLVEDTPPKTAKGPRTAKATVKEAGPSWRDGMAVSASNVMRPGEYQRIAK